MDDYKEGEEALFPQGFFCPLTHELMEDPMMDPEGNTYERKAIENWLQRNSTSPVTRRTLTMAELVPNRALRDAIEERKKQVGEKAEGEVSKAPAEEVEETLVPAQENVKLMVCASRQWTEGEDEALVMASIQPPEGINRTPADICCVVDVSGSMGSEAKMQNENGKREGHGLSILDIVRHAVKTIINVLGDQDRLSLVTFNSAGRVIFDFIPMNAAGKARAQKTVEGLDADGSTNLWDGLYKGLEILANSKQKGRLNTLLLLTDGMPNIEPPRGHLPMLKQYKDQHKHLSCVINTFGFGYDLDSKLLEELAIEGDGIYAFIPDSGFIGTVFVNATSHILSTMAKNCQMSLEPLNGAKIIEENCVLGGHPHQINSWGTHVHLGVLAYGQNRDVVFRMKIPSDLPPNTPYIRATLNYENATSKQSFEVPVLGSAWDQSLEIEVQRHRLTAVEVIVKAKQLAKLQRNEEAKGIVLSFVNELKASPSAKSDARVKALIQDLEGQVVEAISRSDYYKKWGIHYLPSLCRAHLLQVCNNFKDPGVQVYGGKLFNDLRDIADAIFVKMPAPKPSFRLSTGSYRAAPVSMSVYHNSRGVCFDGHCLVQMFDGSAKKVYEIFKGDVVLSGSGKQARVVCVIKTICDGGRTHLVRIGDGLLITPYHPIRLDGTTWCFPCQICPVEEMDCPAVYSFVLDVEHTMLINGLECVSLGHGFQEEIVKHPYFGTNSVIKDLVRMIGWQSGFVQLQTGCTIRESKTGLICGLKQ